MPSLINVVSNETYNCINPAEEELIKMCSLHTVENRDDVAVS